MENLFPPSRTTKGEEEGEDKRIIVVTEMEPNTHGSLAFSESEHWNHFCVFIL